MCLWASNAHKFILHLSVWLCRSLEKSAATDYRACETTRIGMLTYGNVCADALSVLIWRVDYLCFSSSDPRQVPTTQTNRALHVTLCLICIYAKSVELCAE